MKLHFIGKPCFLLLIAFMLVKDGFNQVTLSKTPPKDWHLLDNIRDSFYGLNIKAAQAFVKGKKSFPVIVAVIDSGIDSLHEDLKERLWVNTREMPANGIDDDKNGYIDDVHGWNFLGGKDGRNVEKDSYEVNRVYHLFKDKFEGKEILPETLTETDKYQYGMWLRAKEKLQPKLSGSNPGNDFESIINVLSKLLEDDNEHILDILIKSMEGQRLTEEEMKLLESEVLAKLSKEDMKTIVDAEKKIRDNSNHENKSLEAPTDYRRDIVKDDENNINDRSYGNNNITGSGSLHGTHVAGIIGAIHNDTGMDGVSGNVRIMALRAVPDGDEHDKDIALAIRYAVDNGARIINMSFGKDFSPRKKWVDEAVKYAEEHHVLLVHSAGNDALNIDSNEVYPNAGYLGSGKKAGNWITVGASDPTSGIASFSNYGKKEVDVFAPGFNIYSSVPGNKYRHLSGTSMAAPVVSGLAAFILNYYPRLSAKQVKYIIENSVIKPAGHVKIPGSKSMVYMNELCTSGGLVNAFNAIKLASTIQPEPAGKGRK